MDATLPRTEPTELTFDNKVTGTRIIAALIDSVLLGVLFIAMAATMGDLGSTEGEGFNVSLNNGPFILYAVISLGYYISAEGLLGATGGKMIMGLKVIKLDGNPYGLGEALVRNILRIVDALPFLYIVGLISIGVTKQNQRIGDLAAGTTVVRS